MRGRRWGAVRELAIRRAGRRCQECGAAGRLEVHHIKPLSQGGRRYHSGNLIVLCRGCHLGEHSAVFADRREWRELVGR